MKPNAEIKIKVRIKYDVGPGVLTNLYCWRRVSVRRLCTSLLIKRKIRIKIDAIFQELPKKI